MAKLKKVSRAAIAEAFKTARLPKDDIGRYGKGNINLDSRKVVRNKNGSISTESSVSYNIDGKEVLIPTIVNGRRVSDRQALDHYYKTGEHLGKFNTPDEATEYAKKLHRRQMVKYSTKK